MSSLAWNEDILQFLYEGRNNIPELYLLAQVALSVLATQVNVNRLISSLKYRLSSLR